MSQKPCPFECKLIHVGINAEDTQDANEITKLICMLFGLEYRPGETSDFAGDLVEVMHGNGRGEMGHIAFGVYSIEETREWVEAHGYHFLSDSAKYTDDGKLRLVYLDGSFGGFAVHFVRIPKEA